MIKYLIFLFIILFSSHVIADNMTYRFSSPSFNGMGTSAHFLTIENQEQSYKGISKMLFPLQYWRPSKGMLQPLEKKLSLLKTN